MPPGEAAQAAHEDKLRSLDERQNLGLGIVTGVVEQVTTQPILFWKNSVQQGVPFTLNPRTVFRGTAASCTNMATLTGIQFISSGYLQKLVTGDAGTKMNWGQEVSCAFLGGAISGPACCVLELVMIQQQRYGGTMPGTISRIVSTHGVLGLMRGLVGSTGREAVFTAGYLGFLPATQKYIREHVTVVSPEVAQGVGTVSAGLLCGAITQPMDTAKTCMQGDLERKRYGSLLGTMRTLMSECGNVKALYRGYLWRSTNIVVDFFLLDFLSRHIARVIFPSKFE